MISQPTHTAAPRRSWSPWIAFALVAVAAIAWRILLWPGSMTHDGLWVLEGAEAGVVTTYHPYLNSWLARILVVPFGSIGLYTSLQAAYCLWVVSWVLRQTHKRTGSALVVLAIGVLFATSVPVGLYMGMFWKDVPFSFAVLCIGYALFGLARDRADRETYTLVAISLMFATFMRHGHLFNIVLVPALIAFVAQQKRLAVASFLSTAALWLVLVASAMTWLPVRNDRYHLARVNLLVATQPFLAVLGAPGGYVTDAPAEDQAVLQEFFVPDAIKRYNPKYGDGSLVRPGEQLPPDARKRLVNRVVVLCALNLPKCAGDRIQLMLATLLPADHTYGMTFYDLGSMNVPCGQIYGMGPDHCHSLQTFVLSGKTAAQSARATSIIEALEQKDHWARRLMIWNGAFALLLLSIVLVVSSPRLRVWWSAVFIAAQCAIPFLFSTASDFRYYFPLYLWGLLFLPLCLHAVFLLRWRQPGGALR